MGRREESVVETDWRTPVHVGRIMLFVGDGLRKSDPGQRQTIARRFHRSRRTVDG